MTSKSKNSNTKWSKGQAKEGWLYCKTCGWRPKACKHLSGRRKCDHGKKIIRYPRYV